VRDDQPSVVVLKGGFEIPLAALRLAWRLEEAGITLLLAEGGKLFVRPADKVSPEDFALLRQHGHDLKRLVRYRVV
jgi:hypothetical protein